MVKVTEKTEVLNLVLCTCYNKEDYYCKNWDGKGDASKQTSLVKEICSSNQTNPDKCEFLVKPIPTKGLEWIDRSKESA